MRFDSPVVLATAGTLAIHVIIAIVGDALVVLNPPEVHKPVPHVELIDIEPPAILAPPPPPVAQPEPETKQPEPEKPVEQPRVQKVARRNEPPPPPETHTPPPSSSESPGGAPVATMEGIAPSATGVAVAVGKPGTGRIGRGGTGTGTGTGAGSGAGEVAAPVSVATIKTRAMPRGDFSYFDASKDYPPEARSLGIEGVIRVRLIVDEKGKVKSTTLLNRLGHGLDELALKRAAAIEFDPAKDTNDQPVTSVVVWTFNMTLPK